MLALALAACVQEAGPVTALINVNVVYPASNRVEAQQTVIVTGTTIEKLGPADELRLPRGARIIDADGAFVMPGLTEMHAHVPHHGQGDAYLNDVLFLWVANGVTTIRGMNGEPEHLELRARIDQQEILGPRLLTAGPPFIGRKIKTSAEARSLAAEQAEAGYDFYKVHMGISRKVYDGVVETARERNMPFAGHVAADVGLEHALASGQATIDHLDGYWPALVADDAEITGIDYGLLGAPLTPFIDSEKIKVVAHATQVSGVWNVPTLSMAEKFIRPVGDPAELPGLEYMPPKIVKGWLGASKGLRASGDEEIAAAEKFLDYRQRLVKALHDSGAGLLLGSDAPQILNVPGFSIHRELELMVEAGLTSAEALAAGTVNPARYFGMEDRFGKIAAGLDADLVLVESNPLEDLATLRRPIGVMVRGRWIPDEELRAGLARIAERNQIN